MTSTFDETEIERALLSKEVESLRQTLRLRQYNVSLECGVNQSMLSQWTQGRYKGKVQRINRLMEIWLKERKSGKTIVIPPNKKERDILKAQTKGSWPNSYKRKMEAPFELDDEFTTEDIQQRRLLYDYPKPSTPQVCLVPIHLDITLGGSRLIDSFTWNIHEPEFTYLTFATSLATDLHLPEHFHQPIANAIQTQVNYLSTVVPFQKVVHKESLHLVKLNLRIKDTIFIDEFEWDLYEMNNSPEAFSYSLCKEMGLNGEFVCAIAISIRSQLTAFATLIQAGKQSRSSPLPGPITSVLRPVPMNSKKMNHIVYLHSSDIEVEKMNVKVKTKSVVSRHTSSSSIVKDKADRPPKHVNTFLMFCREWRKTLMTKYPNANANEVSKIMGEMWQKLTSSEREKYRPIADVENTKRLKEWQAMRTANAKVAK